MATVTRSKSLMQAVHSAPTLSNLAAIAAESARRLKAVQPLIPAAMRASVKAGPIADTEWCLIAANSAVSAKLRQLSPALATHLRAQGCEVSSIRVRVQSAPSR
jgi:hypothetical protein